MMKLAAAMMMSAALWPLGERQSYRILGAKSAQTLAAWDWRIGATQASRVVASDSGAQ